MEETTFQWNESANSSYYLFQVATDMDFNNIVYSEAVYNTSVNYSLPETGYYFWRVFALNICQAEIISDTYSMSLNLPEPNDVNLWLNAASENLFLNGDKVAMWHNSVPYSYAAMQPIEIKQPTYILADSCINFQPSIEFSDSYLNLGNVLPLDSIREIFIFAKYDSFGNYPYIFSKGAGGNGAIALNSFQDTSLLRIYTDNIIQNSDWCYPTQKYFLINIQYFSQDSLVVYANNQMILNIDVDVDFLGNSTYDFILGNTAYQSFNNPFYGNIAEFIVADSTLTEQNRDELYNYFHFKYSPPVNLGSDIRIAYNLCDTTITTANRAWFTEFLWSTGDTTPTITIPSSGTGTYSVTTTDIFGYTSSDEIYVEFPFTLAEFNDETICQGDEIIWDADVNNIDYTYSWFGSSETSPILTISEQGEYAVIISDSLGCSYHSDTAFINVDPYTLTASIGPADTTMCSGNSLSLVTNIEETQLYNWSTGSTEPEITITEPGTYNVTVTNTNSCTATDQINVNLQGIAPIADYNYTGSCVMNPILFTDNSTTGSGNIEEWQWYANGTPIGTGNTFEYTFTETGAHIVSLEVTTDEGCSNEVESIIEVSPLPVPDFLPAKACTGNIVDFMSLSNIAVGGITHIDWDFGSGYEQTGEHALFTWENPGSYPIKIKVTSNAGCIDSLESNILVREAPSAIFTTSNACAGYPVYFVNQTEHLPLWPITNYHWILDEDVETGKSDPIHTYDTPGVYPIELAVIALNGCTDTAKISLNVNPIPEADFVNTDACPNIAHTIINNSTISSGTIESNTWVIDSIGTLYSPNAEVQFTDTGSYQTLLIVESNGGCLDTVSKPLIVHPNPLAQFSPDPVWGSVPLEVEFYNDSEGATSYQWIFGDGNESTDIQPVHTFGLEGDYQVELVAESIFGCLDNTLTNIRVIIPAMDIILLNFTTNINNGYLEASVDIVNAGTLPAIDMELVLTAGENNTYREIIYDSFNPGEIIHHVFNAQFFLANDELPPYVCVEAFPGDYEGHTDMNLNDNSICVTNSGSLLVYMPRPNPATNEINFSFVNAEANNTILEIVSATGQKIYFNNFDNLAAGYHTYNIDISSYASGLYTIILTTGEVTENRQFIKE
jgi:PKD repeat protein